MAILVATLPAAIGAERPNVLFIIADDLNTSIGCYGESSARTPNLDRFAESAVCFENAYAQQALCNLALDALRD